MEIKNTSIELAGICVVGGLAGIAMIVGQSDVAWGCIGIVGGLLGTGRASDAVNAINDKLSSITSNNTPADNTSTDTETDNISEDSEITDVQTDNADNTDTGVTNVTNYGSSLSDTDIEKVADMVVSKITAATANQGA